MSNTPSIVEDDDKNSGMGTMLAALWEKSRASVLDRVAVIESAVLVLRSGSLDDDARAAAESAAHKIAGVAGTFGYTDATELAREAETALEGSGVISPEAVLRLGEIAAALREQLSA